MALERTFAILKPDAVAFNSIGGILSRYEAAGLQIIAARMEHLSQETAEGFYAEHSERPFFGELVDFMTSGPCLLLVLEGENAVVTNRNLMGATFPSEAAPGSIRHDFTRGLELKDGENMVHGSDSPESAAREIPLFFSDEQVCARTR